CAGWLGEVEVGYQVAQDRRILADAGPGVGASVGRRVEPGAAEEVVFDEFQVGVAAEGLVVDVPPPGVRGDGDRGHAQAIAVLVGPGRCHVVVDPAPVVPGQEDGGGGPVGALHGGVDDRGDVGLPPVHAGGRMVAVGAGGRDPAHRRQCAGLGRGEVAREILDVLQLVVLLYVA